MIDAFEVCALYSRHAGTPSCEPGTPACDRCFRVARAANKAIAEGAPSWAVRHNLDGATKLIADAQAERLGHAYKRS